MANKDRPCGINKVEAASPTFRKKTKETVYKPAALSGKKTKKTVSKVLAFAFGLAAEIERELISARTKEALAKLKAENKPVGRPKGSLSKSKIDGKEAEIDRYLSKRISIASICKLLEVAPSTFYNFCRHRGIDVRKYKSENRKGSQNE